MVPMPKSAGFASFVKALSAAHGISETTAGRIVEKVALDVHGIDKTAVRSKVAPEVRATIENYFRCRNELLECFGLPGKEHEFVMAYMQGEIAPKEWHPVRSLPAEHASKWNQAVASMFPSLSHLAAAPLLPLPSSPRLQIHLLARRTAATSCLVAE